MNSSDEREDILHLTERLPNKKKTFQLVADYPLADSCMGYIVNYFEQVGRGAAGGSRGDPLSCEQTERHY